MTNILKLVEELRKLGVCELVISNITEKLEVFHFPIRYSPGVPLGTKLSEIIDLRDNLINALDITYILNRRCGFKATDDLNQGAIEQLVKEELRKIKITRTPNNFANETNT